MKSKINLKGEYGLCSSTNDEEREKIKRMPLKTKMDKLNAIIVEHGVRSAEFYNFVKPFIMYALHKSMPYDMFCEDVVNETFIKIIIAFEGGWQEKGKNKVRTYKEAYFDAEKCKNIGNFIYTLARNEATRYMSSQKKSTVTDDITEHLDRTDYSAEEYRRFYTEDVKGVNLSYQFKHFRFNENLINHLINISLNKPSNNVLYNLMLWEEQN